MPPEPPRIARSGPIVPNFGGTPASGLSGGSAEHPHWAWLGRSIAVAAGIPLLAGGTALIGWAAGIEALKRVGAGLPAMNPLTACCLILCGAALAAHRWRRPTIGAALGAAVAIFAAAKLVDLGFGGLPVDRLLFAPLLDEGGGDHPNRMAPNSALALCLAGLALAALGWRRARLFAQLLGFAVVLIGMFALVGHAFGIDRLSAVGPFIPMALATALSLLAVGSGVLMASGEGELALVLRDRGPAGTLARWGLPLGLLSPLAVGLARLWGERLGFFGVEGGVAIMVIANVLLTCLLLIASIVALHRSDADRREREQSLRQSEHFSRTINEASPDCVSLLDLDGNVVFANDAVLRAYGLPCVAALAGRPWGQRLDPSARPAAASALAAARDGGVGRLTHPLAAADGAVRWFESLVSRLADVDGRPISFLVMSRDITQQKRIEDQVRWAATHDALTGLPNRSLFQQRLDQHCAQAEPAAFALLLLDVDHFKQVNDTLGHAAGDLLLRTVGERLRRSVRQADFVARLAGDEFAVILDGVSTETDLRTAAAKVIEALKEPWVYDGRMTDCRLSIGAGIALPHCQAPAELLRKADIALYSAKVRGRDRLAIYEPAMGEAIQRRTSEISLAREALRRDLITPTYQPKVELSTGRVVGFEALLRWRHPSRGMQAPDSLWAAFEDYELARGLTDRMLTAVVADMRRWIAAGIEFGHVAVNASAADFKQSDFAERLLERLASAGVPARRLQVEVTETVFLGRGAEHVERALKLLSAAGIEIALDDFGTGYASLSHLKQFPVDVVKIDRSFLRDIHDPHNAAIIRSVVSLGRSLDLAVVAEGVETREQEAHLVAEGCRLGQGYRYGKAAPAARVPALVRAGLQRVTIAA